MALSYRDLVRLPITPVTALLTFMEAIRSLANAARTGGWVDANNSRISEGLVNVPGSLFDAFTVTGSLVRSALAVAVGATSSPGRMPGTYEEVYPLAGRGGVLRGQADHCAFVCQRHRWR